MEITSPTLDQGQRLTPEFRRNETQVKFELVNHVEVPQPRKPGFFSGLLRTIGALSPLGMFMGPFGMIGSAAGAGLGAIGNNMQQKHYMKEQERLSQNQNMVMGTPGFMSPTLVSDTALQTISASRDGAMGSAIQKM